MKKLALIALVFVALGASAQQDTLKYRISLKDKAATTYSLDHPEKFLSEKAIARRQRQQLPVDSTDLPVCRLCESVKPLAQAFLDRVRLMHGTTGR